MKIDNGTIARIETSVHKKRDGLLLVSSAGACRYMTFFERLAYAVLGRVPKVLK